MEEKKTGEEEEVVTSVFCLVCLTSVFFMEKGQEAASNQTLPKQVPNWKKTMSNTLKSMRISYMNWTYLPRSTGEEETVPQRLLRYSHFPMATQLFAYFAYRAACQVEHYEFVICRTFMDDSSCIQRAFSTSYRISTTSILHYTEWRTLPFEIGNVMICRSKC